MDLFGIKLWPERSIEDEEFPEQRRRRWLWAWALVGLVVAAVLLRPVAGPAFRHFQSERLLSKARQQMATGDVSMARTSLERALYYEPARTDLLEVLADALRAEGSPRYVTMLARAAAIETNRPDLALAAVQACVTNGAVELAVPLIDRFSGMHSDNAELWYWSGRVLEQEGRQAEAAAAWMRACQLAPRDSRIHLGVGIREIASQRPDIVARGMQRLEGLRRDPDGGIRSAAVSALADHAMSSDPRAAAAIWDRYLAENPGDRGAAISHLRVLARVDPASVPGRIATLWANTANLDQRLELVSAVAKISGPEAGWGLIERLTPREKLEAKALVSRLEILAGMGRWPEVVETAEVSAESRSLFGVDDQISVWGWLGVARFSLADVAGFQAASRALEALVGTNADRAMRVGEWLASRGFDYEAAAFFRTASRPNSPRRYAALLALDMLYGRMGDRQKRLLACEQLLQLDSENPAVQSKLASVLLELGWDRERALKLAREAWDKKRASYEFMDTYAHALAMNGLAGDGVALYEQMPPEFLGRDTVRLNYVESLMSAGRFADARLQLNQVKADRLPRAIQPRRDRIEIELRAR